MSCEHGGCKIPASLRRHFTGKQLLLQSHRGWDKGALELARELSEIIGAPLVASETCRLVIDLNRSLHHPHLFSEFTEQCDIETKLDIINGIYRPYRNKVVNRINTLIKKRKPVVHFSVHSFTPRMGNNIRNTDIGLLYNPARKTERMFCIRLQKLIQANDEWKVRRNYPYRGIADGFTTWLRKKYNDRQYCGIELEVNQKIFTDKEKWRLLKKTVINAIKNSLTTPEHAKRL